MRGNEQPDIGKIFRDHKREQERGKRLGAAAAYLASPVGQGEVAGKIGGTGPPTGGSSGSAEAEQAEFLADLHRTPGELLT